MAWPAAVTAAAISGGVQGGLGIFSNITALRTNRLNWERQQLMNNTNWQHYLQDRDFQNAYNSPVAQIQRLRNAGLNPALMYENGGGFVASSNPNVPEMQASKDIAPSMQGLPTMSDVMSVLMTKAQIDNLNANTDKQRSDIDLNNSQIRVNDDSIEVGRVRLQMDERMSDAQVGYLSKQCEDIERNWLKLDADIDAVRANIDLTNSKTIAQDLENIFNSETLSARIDQVYADLDLAKWNISMTKEQFKELCEMFVINKQIAGEQLSQLISQGKFDEKMRPYELLEQQNASWLSGKELQTSEFNLKLAKGKHGRHTVVGRYLDDILGSIGQVLGGTASYSVSSTPKPRAAKSFSRFIK